MGHTLPYELTVTAIYPGDPGEIFANAIQFDDLRRVMEGIATYSGLPDGTLEEGRTYRTDIIFYGLFPVHDHVIEVTRLDADAHFFETREHNRTVTRWDHRLSLEPHPRGAQWVDHLIIDSGLISGLTARGAAALYTRRHRRRNAMTVVHTLRQVP